jgi:hypothetical protein
MLGAKAEADTFGNADSKADRIATVTTGTPRPRTFKCRGRSPGSRVLAAVRAFPKAIAFSDLEIEQRLAAYSCGGSSGLTA